MRFDRVSTAITLASAALALPALATSDLINRDISIDVCGEVEAELKIPNLLLPKKPISFGIIKACLCISTIPQYITGNTLILGAIALGGKAAVIAELTSIVNNCGGRTQCHYPLHSVPSCKTGSPCYFTCKDGYTPSPAGPYPTQSSSKCHKGSTACTVPGRIASSWECINTQNDLESCGGCLYSHHSNALEPVGKDCSAIRGVSDVSCIGGECVVHKCMTGYNIVGQHSECVYAEDEDPEILAAQYGLDHVPL
ncbi:hypothetical protein C8R43DRAFT_1099254 [Mycena crocata]|nr:hypothetical protein C8R43DRAFT_1099254 [Mycena crocata]